MFSPPRESTEGAGAVRLRSVAGWTVAKRGGTSLFLFLLCAFIDSEQQGLCRQYCMAYSFITLKPIYMHCGLQAKFRSYIEIYIYPYIRPTVHCSRAVTLEHCGDVTACCGAAGAIACGSAGFWVFFLRWPFNLAPRVSSSPIQAASLWIRLAGLCVSTARD